MKELELCEKELSIQLQLKELDKTKEQVPVLAVLHLMSVSTLSLYFPSKRRKWINTFSTLRKLPP